MRNHRRRDIRRRAIRRVEANMTLASTRLEATGLTKSFFGVPVLQDVSFEALGGRVLGVVGENGSGKSTTMNLLTGVLQADAGTILLDGMPFTPRSRRESDAAGIAFIQQELNIFPNLSVAENLFLLHPPRKLKSLPFISRRRMYARTMALLKRVNLHVSPEALAGSMSAGERQLLEIARALAGNARIFIFDEPTSSLTTGEAARLFEIIQRLRQDGAVILYISHNLEEVLELCSEVMVMRDGRVTLRAAGATLSASDLVQAMVGRPIETLFAERPAPSANRLPVLEVSGLTAPGSLENINLSVGRGEVVGIAGLMGSGRSELARTLFGLDRHRSGVVRINGKEMPPGSIAARLAAGVAFLTEDRRREGLMVNASVADNMALAALPAFASPVTQLIERTRLLQAIHALGKRLNLKSGDVRTAPVNSLSGGNQQKVVLGKWLLRHPRLFILDEPTRGVDVGAKQEIYQLFSQLADAGLAILVISSELEELLGMCDRIHVMRRGELKAQFTREQFDREAILRAAFGQSDAA
jgi:ribose transport system ATP-binding protein